MVADFVSRQHSTSSPINGETPNQHYNISDIPDTTIEINNMPISSLTNVTTLTDPIKDSSNNNLYYHSQQHHHMSCISPTVALECRLNSSLKGISKINANNMVLNGLQEPMSPQSSDGGNSMFEHVHHMNSNSSSSSYSKYGSGDSSPNGCGYENQHGTKQQQYKDLFTQRKQREFIPENKKDDSYWDRRRRNNEAAKRSREKRRYNDMVLEQRVVELTKENHVLKAQLDAIRDKFNLSGENFVSIEQIMASLPTREQVLSITKRIKHSASNCAVSASSSTNSNNSVSTFICNEHDTDTPQPDQQPLQSSAKLIGEELITLNNEQELISKRNNDSPHMCKSQLTHKGTLNSAQGFDSPLKQQSSKNPCLNSELLSATPTIADICGNSRSNLKTSPNSLYMFDSNTSPPFLDAALPLYQRQAQFLGNQSREFYNSASHHNENFHVLKSINQNVKISGDDIDNLHKVVAVVGAISTNSNNGSAGAAKSSESHHRSTLQANPFKFKHHPYNYTAAVMVSTSKSSGDSAALSHLQLSRSEHINSMTPPTTGTFEDSKGGVTTEAACLQRSSVSSSVANPSIYSETCAAVAASVLNLSRRARSPCSYDFILSSSGTSSSLSSSLCSGALSGDEEEVENAMPSSRTNAAFANTSTNNVRIANSSLSNNNKNSDGNNCLPLKLRLKSHLGDKDSAASALLALQHIKQEPGSSLSPTWGDSSDERDSGISISSSEWFQRRTTMPNSIDSCTNAEMGVKAVAKAASSNEISETSAKREHILKAQLARLECEVANIKMIIRAPGTENEILQQI